MRITSLAFAPFFCLVAHQVLAGDAIAMAFNYEGVWTAVTYNRSSTPKGGAHYHASAQACAFALRDLHSRASEDLAWTKIIGKSDRTGYVTVARGSKPAAGTDVTAIGRGNSQAEADKNALEKLNNAGAKADQKIVYQYFSYGADSGTQHHSAKQQHAKHADKVASKS
jgi:hypothetical protein